MSMTVEAPKEGASVQSNSKLDWKKQKELEEARKAGTAPPEVDEEGRDINPHIPQYITQVPWYVGINRPTLKHQRPQPEKQKLYSGIDEWYKRGRPQNNAATKYRKGACENCGAMTHKKKDCLERPRRVGAKFTGEDIQPDEHTQVELSLDYDGKRDRWAGYDVSRHTKIVEEYAKVDEAKRHLKAKQLEDDLSRGKTDAVKVIGDEEDEEKYADGVDMPGQKFDSKMRTTVRNLRIREDTAKYLYNLDPNSAYYDPKTRSMREDPLKEHEKGKTINYGGDNWVRSSGDVRNMAQTQLFAWEAYERGADVHLQADPTKLELLHKEYKVKKESYKKDTKQGILEKYGGEEHLNVPSKELLLAQTEEYVEYSRTGKVVKGQERAVAKSKYEEDVYINNHSAVWGSFWEDFHWGYSCCHSFIKTSYCTGQAGKVAKKQSDGSQLLASNKERTEADPTDGKSLLELHRAKLAEERESVPLKGSSSVQDDKEKLDLALAAEERRLKYVEDSLKVDERKRSYNSLSTDVKMPTEEEMEAYKIKRQRPEDPMAYFGKK